MANSLGPHCTAFLYPNLETDQFTGDPPDRGAAEQAERTLDQSAASALNRNEQSENLPIVTHWDKIKCALSNNRVVIVQGQTGCGKSTQIPQLIHSAKERGDNRIAVTQPRRLGAISVAERVAKEMGCSSGSRVVTYSVMNDNRERDETDICFKTDGFLLQQLMGSHSVILEKYKVSTTCVYFCNASDNLCL